MSRWGKYQTESAPCLENTGRVKAQNTASLLYRARRPKVLRLRELGNTLADGPGSHREEGLRNPQAAFTVPRAEAVHDTADVVRIITNAEACVDRLRQPHGGPAVRFQARGPGTGGKDFRNDLE